MVENSLTYKDVQGIVAETGKSYYYVLRVLKKKKDCPVVMLAISKRVKINTANTEKIGNLRVKIITLRHIFPSDWATQVSKSTNFSSSFIYMVEKGERENIRVLKALVNLAETQLAKVTL